MPVKNGTTSYLYSVNVTTKAATQIGSIKWYNSCKFFKVLPFNDKIYAAELYTNSVLITNYVYARIYEINQIQDKAQLRPTFN